MGELNTLKEVQEIVNKSEEFNLAQRMVMIELITREINIKEASDDPFIRFFEDVIDGEIEFGFEEVLSKQSYESAQQEAESCLVIFPLFNKMEANTRILGWLSNALKYTDELALHYIQDILQIAPIKDPNHGTERSRYIQINNKYYTAQAAGLLLNNLYDQRNKLEHRTKWNPDNPDIQIIVPPKFRKAKIKIQKSFPKALISFKRVYIEHYR